MSRAIGSAFGTTTGPGHGCDDCPMGIFTRLVRDIRDLGAAEAHDVVLERIGCLGPSQQESIFASYKVQPLSSLRA